MTVTDHNGAEQLGHALEDFQVGDVFYHWPGRTVTDYDNMLATFFTVNPSSLHFDSLVAERAGHPGLLVNGGLVLMIVHGLTVRDISSAPPAIVHLGFDRVRMHKPTYGGDTLYAMSKVTDVRESASKPDRGIVTVHTVGVNQRKEKVISFDRAVMVYKRDFVPEEPPIVSWAQIED